MITHTLLTKKAQKVIWKRLRNEKLTQQDSNYLSRFVRPKLRGMASIDAKALLKKLEYNPGALSRERKIKSIILENIPYADAIILCGSAIQTNYREYNDIDVIVVTKKVVTKSLKEKEALIEKIRERGNKENLNLDIQLYPKELIVAQVSSNPSLIYQLKDSRCIYGKMPLPKTLHLSRLDLKMKLDWSEGLNSDASASEIYHAIRNAMLVLLLMNKKVDNAQLRENITNAFGADVCVRLKNDTALPAEKKLALEYLNALLNYLEAELNKPVWEKHVIENRS